MARVPIKPVSSGARPKIGTQQSPKAVKPKAVIQAAISPPKKPAPKSADEMLYYGFHACCALFKNRRDTIIRAYCTEERLEDMGLVLKWCANNKKAYHVVTKEDLEKVTASVHHEGVALLAKRKMPLPENELFARLQMQRQPLVVLDEVLNPHNIGSIMRAMAHFGWQHLVCAEQFAVQVSSSAARMSEGGSEYVDLTFYKDATSFLKNLKALGYQTVGSSTHAKRALYTTKLNFPALAFFLGNEITGLSKSLVSKLDFSVSIPSSGSVESLNVAMASALLIGECVRQHGLNP